MQDYGMRHSYISVSSLYVNVLTEFILQMSSVLVAFRGGNEVNYEKYKEE